MTNVKRPPINALQETRTEREMMQDVTLALLILSWTGITQIERETCLISPKASLRLVISDAGLLNMSCEALLNSLHGHRAEQVQHRAPRQLAKGTTNLLQPPLDVSRLDNDRPSHGVLYRLHLRV